MILSEASQRTASLRELKESIYLSLIVIVLILIIFYDVTESIVSTWIRSETYAHGFLIFPFSFYMIWKKRASLYDLTHYPEFKWLMVLSLLGFGWLLGFLSSVLVVKQFALVSMIPIVVCAMMGFRFAWSIAFPLAYLFFAIPVGESLIPPLIDFTADFTVSALQLTGIPVYREGSFFSIPSGNWSVVEACSGLRYLIASVTLGTLYAYLTYTRWLKRLIFIIFSVIVPIIANGLRAYLIVITGHLSDMKLAVGVDHLIYGWIFFGLVMLLLFWIGSFWREDQLGYQYEIQASKSRNSLEATSVSLKLKLLMAFLIITSVLIWPIYAKYLNDQVQVKEILDVKPLDPLGKWIAVQEPVSNWAPYYIGNPSKYYYLFKNNNQLVSLYITYYQNQNQNSELINSGNVLVGEMAQTWRQIAKSQRKLSLDSKEMEVNQHQLVSNTSNLLIWRWYWLINEQTANPYIAKAILAFNKILGYGDDGAEIILAAPYVNFPEEAMTLLQNFTSDMLPVIIEALQSAKNSDD